MHIAHATFSHVHMDLGNASPLLIAKRQCNNVTGYVDLTQAGRPRGVMVSTQDSESCDPSSNLGGTWKAFEHISVLRALWETTLLAFCLDVFVFGSYK